MENTVSVANNSLETGPIFFDLPLDCEYLHKECLDIRTSLTATCAEGNKTERDLCRARFEGENEEERNTTRLALIQTYHDNTDKRNRDLAITIEDYRQKINAILPSESQLPVSFKVSRSDDIAAAIIGIATANVVQPANENNALLPLNCTRLSCKDIKVNGDHFLITNDSDYELKFICAFESSENISISLEVDDKIIETHILSLGENIITTTFTASNTVKILRSASIVETTYKRAMAVLKVV